ncbi:MAG: PDZ domain-containing protein [Gammaproteobacteria bacterium]
MKTVLTVFLTAVLVLPPLVYAQTGNTQAQPNTPETAADRQQLAQNQTQLDQNQQKLEANQQKLEQQMQEARRQMQAAAQRMAELTLQMEGPMVSRITHLFDPKRAVLGVSIEEADASQNASGAQVLAVTPGGPADKAGLRTGDVITAINGMKFKSDKQASAADKLMDFMDEAKPGETLKLSYLRNGRDFTTDVKAGRLSDYSVAMGMPPIPPPPPVPPVRPSNLRAIYGPPPFFGRGWPWGDMQLVQLTPGLGQYFDTNQGLLVVRAPHDPALKLADGDVILKIGNREPGTPSHAMRILYSYGPGETLTLHILRKHRPLTLSITVPKTRKPSAGPYRPMSLQDQAFIARWVDQGLG